jgi:RecB family exonuclease
MYYEEMKKNVYSHDHFNTWQRCPGNYFFKYIKKLDLPNFTRDYELGKSFHALIDYHLRGLPVEHLLTKAPQDVKNVWNLIIGSQILKNKLIKTEWSFNTRIADTENWLVGRIDAIFYDEKTGKYIIADWKTGKYIPRNEEAYFQHKVYLYALYNSRKDLGLDFRPEELEFSYIKITDGVYVNTISFSSEKERGYADSFLGA